MPALPGSALEALLADDVPCDDLTTDTLAIGGAPARLTFTARQRMVVCATEEAVRLFELGGARATLLRPSGSTLDSGEPMIEAAGTAASLHRAWKTAQTLVEWASGVSSATAAIVAAAGDIPVACTRKNVPGTKALSAKAVRAGGGIMHRLGLSETLLVFSEHRLFVTESPAATIDRLRRAQPEKCIVVEVGSPVDAAIWARAGADIVQLEKFTPEQVAQCRSEVMALGLQRPPRLAAAGGVKADNAAAYAAAGADLLVSSAPYTAPPRDVKVTFFPVG